MTACVNIIKCKKKCKTLLNEYINLFWLSNGLIRLKLSANGRSHIITHINDIEEQFASWKCIFPLRPVFLYQKHTLILILLLMIKSLKFLGIPLFVQTKLLTMKKGVFVFITKAFYL